MAVFEWHTRRGCKKGTAVTYSEKRNYAKFALKNWCKPRTYLLHGAESSWEANRFSASQEIARILWNPKVPYHIRKCLPSVPILSHIDPVHALTFHFLKTHLNIILPSSLGLPSGLFPSIFPTKPSIHLCSTPYVLHSPPTSFFSISSPEK